MLLTIAVEKMPDYLWMKTGQPTHGEGGSPSYMMTSNKNEGEWKFYILQEFINR